MKSQVHPEIEQAVAADPSNPEVRLQAAESYAILGQFQQARLHAEQALPSYESCTYFYRNW